jgi:hypothetical protein
MEEKINTYKSSRESWRKDHVEDLGVGERIILKLALKK